MLSLFERLEWWGRRRGGRLGQLVERLGFWVPIIYREGWSAVHRDAVDEVFWLPLDACLRCNTLVYQPPGFARHHETCGRRLARWDRAPRAFLERQAKKARRWLRKATREMEGLDPHPPKKGARCRS